MAAVTTGGAVMLVVVTAIVVVVLVVVVVVVLLLVIAIVVVVVVKVVADVVVMIVVMVVIDVMVVVARDPDSWHADLSSPVSYRRSSIKESSNLVQCTQPLSGRRNYPKLTGTNRYCSARLAPPTITSTGWRHQSRPFI